MLSLATLQHCYITSTMYSQKLSLVLLLLASLTLYDVVYAKDPILVHALFRHGHRTPEAGSCYATDPYRDSTFYPYGFGQLTNEKTESTTWESLRDRYDSFLGDIFTEDILDVRSTSYNRTKMSLELVLAGLFPPRSFQIWNLDIGLKWQPIPFNFWDLADDNLLGDFSHPDFANYRYNQFLQNKELQDLFIQDDSLYQYLNKYSGNNITNFDGIMGLYDVLMAESQLDLPLPVWTTTVFPDKLKPIAGLSFAMNAGDLWLKQKSSGALIQKIVQDSVNKINGTIKPRIFLYSAHDINVGAMLETLGVYDRLPPIYGSCVIFEVHEIDGVYGIKLFYINWATVANEPQLLKLPECEEFCPLDQFISIVEKYYPPAAK